MMTTDQPETGLHPPQHVPATARTSMAVEITCIACNGPLSYTSQSITSHYLQRIHLRCDHCHAHNTITVTQRIQRWRPTQTSPTLDAHTPTLDDTTETDDDAP